MGNWSIQRKTAASFVAAIAVLAATIGATYLTTESFLRSASTVPNSFEAIAAQERLYSELVDMMWNQRAYVSGNDPADLAARAAARDRLVAASALLPTMPFAATAQQRQRVDALREAISQQLQLMDLGLSTRGGRDVTPEQQAAMRANGRALLTTIRGLLDSIERTERERLAAYQRETARAAMQLYATIAAIAVLFTVAFGWSLRRILRDLKIRDQVDASLHQTNAFLESLLENIPSMIFVKDAEHLRFVRFNRAGEQLLGHSRQDLIGKSDRDFFPAEQADFFIAKDREVFKKGQVVDIPEEEIDTKLQGRRILHTRKVPIVDAKGQPAILLGISMDITEQTLAERKVHRLNDELKQQTELLTAANQELESFCYSVSHDLRAPLRAIDGYASILSQEHSEQLDDGAKRFLAGIRNNSKHMAELIDDLLEFSRLSRQQLEMSAVDMTSLAQQAASEVTDSTSTLAAKISIQPMHASQGDARALYHVWLNLVDNAVKYSSHAAQPAISIWAERRVAEIVYSVQDNGVGFDMRYYDKLFGVFERLHSSKEYPGTGVGLAIVKRVIARHGGRVWAESKPGHGATFHFALPALLD